MADRLAEPSATGSSLARSAADPLAQSVSAAMPAAAKQKRKPPGLTLLSAATVAPASTFNLSETGSFEKGGFKIKASGISATPARRGDFSSLTLDQLDVLDTLGAGACGTVRRARHRPTGKTLALKVINIMGEQGQRHQVRPWPAPASPPASRCRPPGPWRVCACRKMAWGGSSVVDSVFEFSSAARGDRPQAP
jgi:hypothetical protein